MSLKSLLFQVRGNVERVMAKKKKKKSKSKTWSASLRATLSGAWVNYALAAERSSAAFALAEQFVAGRNPSRFVFGEQLWPPISAPAVDFGAGYSITID